MKKPHYSISDLSAELGITPRSIRYYEEKGLIRPSRSAGNQRIYAKKDRARLRLILRGRRFGYSLDEIAAMIGLADVDIHEREQIQRALNDGEKKLADIRQRMKELKTLEADMLAVRKKLHDRLAKLDREGGNV